MTMSHKEALRVAVEAMPMVGDSTLVADKIVRAYLDARGLVVVPREPTLTMQGAALQYVSKQKQTRDVYRAMLAAAPDPFGGE